MKTSIAVLATAAAIDAFGNPAAVALTAAAALVLWIGYEFIDGLCTPNR